jgi:nucleotide-binding universal stress UspA family protein
VADSSQSASLPRKMLVAVEGSEPSLRESSIKAAKYALKLASLTGAELIGICVVQIPEYIEENTRAILRSELSRKSEVTLDEIRGMASELHVKFNSRVVETSGGIGTAICNLSTKEGVDLIVLGTRSNTSSLSKMMLGSVAAGVVGNSDCPVLVVR